VAASGEKELPERPGNDRGWKLSDRLQLVAIVVSLAALAAALYATWSANKATTRANQATARANQLAASANRADLILGSRPSAHLHRPSSYQVSIDLSNQGGGTARSIKAYIGTLGNVRKPLTNSCPHLERSFLFFFPRGTALGTGRGLPGTVSVPVDAVPPHGTPTNSMVLYVSWQNTDGTKSVSCLDLSNRTQIGDLQRLTG